MQSQMLSPLEVAVQTQSIDFCSKCLHYEKLTNQLAFLKMLGSLESSLMAATAQISILKSELFPKKEEKVGDTTLNTQSKKKSEDCDSPEKISLANKEYVSIPKILAEASTADKQCSPFDEQADRIEEPKSCINITKVENKVEQKMEDFSLIELMEQLEDNKIEHFGFAIRQTPDLTHFSIQGNRIKYKRTDQKLLQVISSRSFPKEKRQRIGIKVIVARSGWIYFGLLNQLQLSQKSTAKVKSKNMISYRIGGGKQLHVLQQSEAINVPRVPTNSCLYMQLDGRKGSVEWFIDEKSVAVVEDRRLLELEWFPFLTFKHELDQIQLL